MGAQPGSSLAVRQIQRWGLSEVSAFFFSAAELGQVWEDAGILRPAQTRHNIMETSSALTWMPKEAARAQSGMSGNPILLWTGNLTANKDPLTILEAFAKLQSDYPEARLYMAFREETLLPDIKSWLANHQQVQAAVSLLGAIPYSEMTSIYNSADIFVQGSRREASGIAILDALACGVVPVITDIPAFRQMLAGSSVGALWPVGEVSALSENLRAVCQTPFGEQAALARAHFKQSLSFTALGQLAKVAYEAIYAEHQSR